jgi:hypothetical protein
MAVGTLAVGTFALKVLGFGSFALGLRTVFPDLGAGKASPGITSSEIALASGVTGPARVADGGAKESGANA